MLHDGTFIKLEKLAANRDPFNRMEAMNALRDARNRNEILTGLLFIDPETEDLHHTINSTERPLNTLEEEDLCPGSAVLTEINDDLR
jgi:2-oxoglutarate ferredoxin oxidoreductase subunit beta